MTCRIRAGEVARPRMRLHPKGCSARSWLDRSGDPSCLGPPLLPVHFCRPVIRTAAGLGVRPDRPAAVAGACRQEGILTYGSPKIPTESVICGVTHHLHIRMRGAISPEMSTRSRSLAPPPEYRIPARKQAYRTTPRGLERDERVRRRADALPLLPARAGRHSVRRATRTPFRPATRVARATHAGGSSGLGGDWGHLGALGGGQGQSGGGRGPTGGGRGGQLSVVSAVGGSATRAARRSPSRTRSARARVGACTSFSPLCFPWSCKRAAGLRARHDFCPLSNG
jgi:hypothetical protein